MVLKHRNPTLLSDRTKLPSTGCFMNLTYLFRQTDLSHKLNEYAKQSGYKLTRVTFLQHFKTATCSFWRIREKLSQAISVCHILIHSSVRSLVSGRFSSPSSTAIPVGTDPFAVALGDL